jgi:hypothetical protein
MRFNMLMFGETFEDIIAWQDIYVETEGKSHRKYRHDPDTTPTEAIKHFIIETGKYPESKKDIITNVIRAHIACDLLWTSAKLSTPIQIQEPTNPQAQSYCIFLTESHYDVKVQKIIYRRRKCILPNHLFQSISKKGKLSDYCQCCPELLLENHKNTDGKTIYLEADIEKELKEDIKWFLTFAGFLANTLEVKLH